MAFSVPADITPGIDETEARRALEILTAHGQVFEIRALPSKRSWVGRDIDAAMEAVRSWGTTDNIYFTLNPCRPDLKRAATNADILERYLLLIDADPRRPDEDQPATDGEKHAATDLADMVRLDLTSRGCPAPIVVDSGNGVQLLYRVDLPNDRLSHQRIKGILKNLAERYDTDAAHVDLSVHNAGRIARLPGTWNRKGQATADRPHRMACLVSLPVNLEPIPADLLSDLAGKAVGPADDQPGSGFTVPPMPAVGSDPSAWFRKALEHTAGNVALARPGVRHNLLRAGARTMAGYVHFGYLTEAEIRQSLRLAGERSGLELDDIRDAIEWGVADGLANPLGWPDKLSRPKAGKAGEAIPDPQSIPDDDLIIWGDKVEPKKVDWLWENRIPFGFITIFAGRTGVGKSFVTCYIVARHTVGGDLPDSNGICLDAGRALIISEDPYDTMLAPRLIELEADMTRVAFMTWKAMAAYTLSDVAMLERVWMAARQPELIMIDPPTNFLEGVDEHKNVEVRRALTHLVGWLQGKRVACILITHLNKQVGKGVDAMSRIIGSVAWGTTSRIAHTFSPHPDKADECIFAAPKSNLGPLPLALGYRIVPTDTFATLEWTGVVDITADEAMSGQGRTRKVAASEWLIERFREKLEWPSDELFERAREDGVSRSAVFEAKDALMLPRARQTVYPDGTRKFVWWVPPDWPQLRNNED